MQYVKSVLLANMSLKKSIAKSMNYRQRLKAYLKKDMNSNQIFQDSILTFEDFGQDLDLNVEDDLSDIEEDQEIMQKDAQLIKKLKGKYMKKVIAVSQGDEFDDQID